MGQYHSSVCNVFTLMINNNTHAQRLNQKKKSNALYVHIVYIVHRYL